MPCEFKKLLPISTDINPNIIQACRNHILIKILLETFTVNSGGLVTLLRPAEAPLEPRGELVMASTLLMCEWGYRSSLVLLGFCYLMSLRSQRFSRGPASVGRVQSIPVDLMIPISKFIPLLSIMYICMQSFSQDVKIAYNDGDHNSLSSDPDTSTVLFSSYAIYLNTRKQVICPILQMRNRASRDQINP